MDKGGKTKRNRVVSSEKITILFSGVFQSLQKGFSVDARDIDAAINNICEESLPLETNMTSFLHATCGHFQKVVNEAEKKVDVDMVAKETVGEPIEGEMPKKPSVRFLDFLDESDG